MENNNSNNIIYSLSPFRFTISIISNNKIQKISNSISNKLKKIFINISTIDYIKLDKWKLDEYKNKIYVNYYISNKINLAKVMKRYKLATKNIIDSSNIIKLSSNIVTLHRAYKCRLYPNKNQEELILKTFGCSRFIYNKILENAKKVYEDTGEHKICPYTKFSNQEKYSFLKEIDTCALNNAKNNIKIAFSNFLRRVSKIKSKSLKGKVDYPRFKSKKKNRQSYTTNNVNVSIGYDTIRINNSNNKLKLPKLGYLKISPHISCSSNYFIKNATVSKDPDGKYYVSIIVEFTKEIIPIEVNKDKVLGLDFSMKNLYVGSNNQKINYPRYYRKYEKLLVKAQRSLSRKKKGSKNKNK